MFFKNRVTALVIFFLLFLANAMGEPKVVVGIDVLLKEEKYKQLIRYKKVGLITNHTAVNGRLQSSIDLIKLTPDVKLVALFAPEHGIKGNVYADADVDDEKDSTGVPIYSLYGKTRRPTAEMLKNIDVLIVDMQDIGSRSYTYVSTLCYVMEEAAKRKIRVIVTDRPNPLGGEVVDGLLLDPKCRSFVGYLNVPYCHGMTLGELALFFNQEEKIGCDLIVVPMRGWKRKMSFVDTELHWVPTSPQIPEAETPFFYPIGILGELGIVNIGVGYTLPFKVVGAPWIDAEEFANKLNALKFPGVVFQPFHFRPFFGSFKNLDCQGVKLVITNKTSYLPVSTQYLIMGMIKSLYPSQFKKAIEKLSGKTDMFHKVNGTEEVYRILSQEKYAVFELKKRCQQDRERFSPIRKKYLIPEYGL